MAVVGFNRFLIHLVTDILLKLDGLSDVFHCQHVQLVLVAEGVVAGVQVYLGWQLDPFEFKLIVELLAYLVP